MSEKQKSVCDSFVYIPQYGPGTASLNVNVATGIVLNWYSNLKSLSPGKHGTGSPDPQITESSPQLVPIDPHDCTESISSEAKG